MINETHNPQLESWVDSANVDGCDFPIQNLPLGVFQTVDRPPQVAVAIGDSLLPVGEWLPGPTLNAYLALPSSDRSRLRLTFSKILRKGSPVRDLIPMSDCEMLLPASIGDYTDFYASIHHASNVGSMFRPENPLLPNYKHVPVAYHGRSSSIVVSGAPIERPCGQLGEDQFGTTQNLDYEVELGAFIGPGNRRGDIIPLTNADQHLAGLCLLNDWSARDIQRWEYQPLGPFLAKNFATTISPWLVTSEALEPFRVPVAPHDVPTLPYLTSDSNHTYGITVEAFIRTGRMHEPLRVSSARFGEMYWSFAQMIAHHASNGCPLRPGDLLGSGTISGPEKSNRGCLLELTKNGREPLELPSGEQRTFLHDGDEVILTAHCDRPGFRRIGFGNCSGKILPSTDLSHRWSSGPGTK